jgi:hypothetical protein
VDEPVLFHAVALVEFALDQVVAPSSRRRQNLDHELGRAAATTFVELGQIAHDRDVGLDDLEDKVKKTIKAFTDGFIASKE